MLTKKQVSAKIEKIAMLMGLFIIVALMITAFYNDYVYW
jgi:membrane-associated protease RseP (regulator of RpoE activity)